MKHFLKKNEIENSFWKGKKVLITGHTGFKGSWLTIWLNQIGAKVYGISLAPDQKPSLFEKAKISRYCESIICDIIGMAKRESFYSNEVTLDIKLSWLDQIKMV